MIFSCGFMKSINNLSDYLWKEVDFMILAFRGQNWGNFKMTPKIRNNNLITVNYIRRYLCLGAGDF